MIVMKFGGSSVANRSQIEKVLGIVADRRDRAPLVVSSAHKGITDALVAAAHRAAAGELDHPACRAPIERQRMILAELGGPAELLEPLFAELADLLRGLSLVRELSPRCLDYVSSFGERMAVRAIADFFTRSGVPARACDVWELGFVTDQNFGVARPLPGWEADCRRAVAALPAGEIPIVTGFVGKTAAGEITTVGRNGSDLTASLLGAALGAEEVQIWTDTDGVMSADPSVVEGARNIPHMRFDEAAELAYFGSRVLHPSTLLPAMAGDIPVRVLNTNRPEHRGTVIRSHEVENPNPVTSIAYREGQSVLYLQTTRMFAQPGFLARLFTILGRHRVDVDVITTSEVSVSLTSGDRGRLEAALPELEALAARGETQHDASLGLSAEGFHHRLLAERGRCELRHGKAVLVIVGQHLPQRPGLGARILGGIADAGVNVEMISYGMDSINFTLVIDDADIDRAVSLLHRMLFADA